MPTDLQLTYYEDEMKIDENALDVEWLEQPMLLYRYSRLAADARHAANAAKSALTVVKAEVAADMRADPDKYELTKVTEGSIKEAVDAEPRVRKAQQALDKAWYEVELCQAAVTAADHRRKALENLVQLLKLNYFASPHEPRDFSAEATKRREQSAARERVRGAMRKGQGEVVEDEGKTKPASKPKRRRRRIAEQ